VRIQVSKFEKAQSLGVTVLNEDEFEDCWKGKRKVEVLKAAEQNGSGESKKKVRKKKAPSDR